MGIRYHETMHSARPSLVAGPIRWLILAILVGVPLLVWFDAQERGRAREQESATRAIQGDLRGILANLGRRVDPRQRFEDLTRRVVNALRWGEDPAPVLAAAGLGPGTGEGAFRLFLFDGKGRRRTATWTPTGLTNASERTLALLRRAAADPDFEMTSSERRLVTSFLGTDDAVALLVRHPHRLHDLGEKGVARLVGVFPYRDRRHRRGYVLALVDLPSLDMGRLVRAALDRVDRLAGPHLRLRWGLADLALGRFLPVPGGTPLPPARLQALDRRRPCTEHLTPTTVEATNLLGERFLVAAAAPLAPPPANPYGTWPVQGGFFLGCLVLLEGLIRVLRTRFVALRWQILGLFGLAAGVSLATLLGFGRMAREAREEGLIREQVTSAGQILEKLDQGFAAFLDRQADRYGKLMRGATTAAAAQRRLRAARPWLGRARSAISVHSIGKDGHALFRQEPAGWYSLKELWGRDTYPILTRIGLSTLAHLNDPVAARQELSHTGTNFEKSVAIGLGGECAGFVGRLGVFTAGTQRLRLFSDVARTPDNHAIATLLISHENNSLERSYLWEARRRIRNLPGGRELRFTAFLRPGIPRAYAAFRTAADDQAMRDLIDLTARTSAVEATLGRYRGREAILVACPGRGLADYVLVLATPLEPIRAMTRRLERGFQVIAGLLLLFALGLGLIFSDLLLGPVGALSEGIRHLQGGSFPGFSPPRTGDVLQEIGHGIGGIMDEMRNLATARAIHEQLFPAGPLIAGAFRLSGRSRSVSDIGDEIFDYRLEQGGQVVFWMASLPGTLLGSALGLAMTKMALRLSLDSGAQQGSPPTGARETDPAAMVRQFVAGFLARHPGLAGAGVLIGHLDTGTGRVRLAARGAFRWGLEAAEDRAIPAPEPRPSPPGAWGECSRGPFPRARGNDGDSFFIGPGQVFRIASPGQIAAGDEGASWLADTGECEPDHRTSAPWGPWKGLLHSPLPSWSPGQVDQEPHQGTTLEAVSAIRLPEASKAMRPPRSRTILFIERRGQER